MTRDRLIKTLRKGDPFDLLVIGGGSVGCGTALDAASRGLKVALLEKGDFASGTSGRSTKLLHGGVRYLEAAVLHLDRVQFRLVKDALFERGLLFSLAPHLTRRLTLVMPLYRFWDIPYVFTGLKLYDLLAGRRGIGKSRLLSRKETVARFPVIKKEGLRGAVLYHDGQFDDARMNLALALTALEQGALVANYLEVTALLKEGGRVAGALVRDSITEECFTLRARGVVNAAGPAADLVRRLDHPESSPLLRPSSGVHIALERPLVPVDTGITIPKTEDGRVLFILSWQGRCLVGTTDEPVDPGGDPVATEREIEFLLRHVNRYFDAGITRSEVRAAWSGVRPLLSHDNGDDTAALARDHLVAVSESGLVTVTGGKWTTYRRMAMDAVDRAVAVAGLAPARGCHTERILLAGGAGYLEDGGDELAQRFRLPPESARHLHTSYGGKAPEVAELCRGALSEELVPGHPYLKGEVLYAVRCEFALRAVDVLARRLPLALLDAAAAQAAAPVVLELMARELSWDEARLREEEAALKRWFPPGTAAAPAGRSS